MTKPPVSPLRIFVFDHPPAVSQIFNKLFTYHGDLETHLPSNHERFYVEYGPERTQLIYQYNNLAEDT